MSIPTRSEVGGTKLGAYASRGTPQGGVISPLLWVIVLNEALQQLEKFGVKIIAYADDVVLLTTGKFLPTLS